MVSLQGNVTEKIEGVQKRAMKLVSSCKGLAYSERLKVLSISALKYRHYRGDVIEMYKILHGIYHTAVSPDLPVCQDSVTRGNNCKLVKNISRYDIRKYFFTQG